MAASWSNVVKIQTCPLCGKSHDHTLAFNPPRKEGVIGAYGLFVKREVSTIAAHGESTVKKEVELFLRCPNTNQLFEAKIRLSLPPNIDASKIREV